MNCPKCDGATRVADSRDVRGERLLRRRRECLVCLHRFTTYEREVGPDVQKIESPAALLRRALVLMGQEQPPAAEDFSI